MDFEHLVETIGKVGDGFGVLIIVTGTAVSTAIFLRRVARREDGHTIYRSYRQSLGRSILLGLEVLVAADIIRTVATEPTFRSVGVLGLIVLIRTFLSLSLEIELEGRLPWQKGPGGL